MNGTIMRDTYSKTTCEAVRRLHQDMADSEVYQMSMYPKERVVAQRGVILGQNAPLFVGIRKFSSD